MDATSNKREYDFMLLRSRDYQEKQLNDFFALQDIEYVVDLQPKTQYWRFGIRFSDDPLQKPAKPFDYNFFIGGGIQQSASGAKSSNFEPSLIIGHSGLSPIIDIPPSIPYDLKSPVRLNFQLKESTFLIHIGFPSYGQDLSFLLPSNNFTYFTLYAWSDGEPVELHAIVESLPSSLTSQTAATTTTTKAPTEDIPVDPPKETPINYYLIKIRDETWNVRGFQVGRIDHYSVQYPDKKKRPDEKVFLKLKPGDQILGYECESEEEIVCIFKVNEASHRDGDINVVTLQLIKLVEPTIPLSYFRQKIDFAKQLPLRVPEKLFPLSKEQFETILQPRQARDPHSSVLGSYTAEGNHLQTKDQLDFAYDILSFATIIALKEVKPPLAIGLFGNWGSGKSFFMEQLEKEINEKANNPGELFIQNVVQVKFNSWHYSDANLWASLITEIFDHLYSYAKKEDKIEELEKLSETLQITNLQKGAAETKKLELEQRQRILEEEQRIKREELKDISGIALAKLILKDSYVSEDLKAFSNENIEKIFEQKDKIEILIKEVKTTGNQVTYFFRTWFSFRGRGVYVLLAVFLLFIGFLSVQNIHGVADWWKSITAKLLAWVTMATTLFTTAWQAFKPVRENLQLAYNRLKSLKETINARPAIEDPSLDDNKKQLQAVKTSIETLDQKIQETQRTLDDIRSGRRLLEFIEQRSRDEQYAKQLGLISWIRKDFKKLDELLRQLYEIDDETEKAKMNPSNIQLRIDRIVLYIDDLDRCNEDIVVHVLEAVHLLLAFPLFVVVVGVDPRWLKKSLNKKYSFFSENGEKKKTPLDIDPVSQKPKEEDDTSAISSFDYLEKIFQVPFALKPITKEGREALIGYLVEAEIEKEMEISGDSPASIPKTTIQDQDSAAGSDDTPPIFSGIAGSPSPEEIRKIEMSANARAGASAVATATALKALKFTKDEVEFMKEVSVLFGHSPRTIKRFVNIYRIIRSHGNLDPATDYRATLLLLAIIVGCPQFAQDFIVQLQASNQNTIEELLRQKELSDLQTWITKQLKNKPMPKIWRNRSIVSLQANLELISRFSFRTYAY